MASVLKFLAAPRRVSATLGYVGGLIAVNEWLADLDDARRAEAVQAASTNLHNLSHLHLSTLLTSAFVGAGSRPVWWVTIIATLAVAELELGSLRVVKVFIAGHVGATLVVAVGLAVGIWAGWFPQGWADATDVGVSYGMVAVVAALTLWLPSPARLLWAAIWGAALLAGLLRDGGFTDAGHVCAFLIGLAVGYRLRHRLGPDEAAAQVPVGSGRVMSAIGRWSIAAGVTVLAWWLPQVWLS